MTLACSRPHRRAVLRVCGVLASFLILPSLQVIRKTSVEVSGQGQQAREGDTEDPLAQVQSPHAGGQSWERRLGGTLVPGGLVGEGLRCWWVLRRDPWARACSWILGAEVWSVASGPLATGQASWVFLAMPLPVGAQG